MSRQSAASENWARRIIAALGGSTARADDAAPRRSAAPARRSAVGAPAPRAAAAPGGGAQLYILVLAALVTMLVAIVIVVATSLTGSAPNRSPTTSASLAQRTRGLPAFWIVRRGQTYSMIAAKTGLTVDELEQLNPLQDPANLVPGEHIKLRPGARLRHVRRGPKRDYWTIRRGDTMSSIASRNGLSLIRIRELNPHVKPDLLTPGKRLKLRR